MFVLQVDWHVLCVCVCSRCQHGEVMCLLSTWFLCMCLCCCWCNATAEESTSVSCTDTHTIKPDNNFQCSTWCFKLPHIAEMETVCNEKTDLHSFLCVSQHRCKHLTLKQAQMPSQAVLISHNLKHSIIGSADIHTPTHHLTVNAAGCYLILFIFFHLTNTRCRVLGKRIGVLSHRTSQFHKARGSSGTLSVGSELKLSPPDPPPSTQPPSA